MRHALIASILGQRELILVGVVVLLLEGVIALAPYLVLLVERLIGIEDVSVGLPIWAGQH